MWLWPFSLEEEARIWTFLRKIRLILYLCSKEVGGGRPEGGRWVRRGEAQPTI